MKPKIRVSDVVTYSFCERQFYFQRVLGIIPKPLQSLFKIGCAEHESFEAENQNEHDKKPEAKEGKPYVFLLQEMPLSDKKNNISGRIDTLYICGTSFLSNADTRKLLIIDKKRHMNELYFLQLYGYAHLIESSKRLEAFKPFETFGQIVHNCGQSDEIPITESKKAEFLLLARKMQEHLGRMMAGEIPKPKPEMAGKCANCFFGERCGIYC